MSKKFSEMFKEDDTDKRPSQKTTSTSAQSKTRVGKKGVLFYPPLEAGIQLKILAAETGETQSNLLIEALNGLFKKYKKPPIA